MYVTDALSVFGLPLAQAAPPIEPSVPWAGPLTIEKVSSQVSGSRPDRATPTATSVLVVALVAFAVGGVFGGGPPPLCVTTSCGALAPSLLLKMALLVPSMVSPKLTTPLPLTERPG